VQIDGSGLFIQADAENSWKETPDYARLEMYRNMVIGPDLKANDIAPQRGDVPMKTCIGWGIMATGTIARKFCEGLKVLGDAELVAVASRSMEKARAFGAEHGIKRAYGSYEALAQDPDVDIVYIATPHPMHFENAMLCLEAGKAVLCEKPFTMNAREAEALIAFAREKGLFLMEAMWTRYLPAIVKVREWLSKGLIGEVRFLKADFGYRCVWDPGGRLLNPALGGGALLDVGIYPVSFASMIFGNQPRIIQSLAHIGETGVDEQFAALFEYEGGAIASLSGALRTDFVNDALILGTHGRIHVPDFFYAKTATFRSASGAEEVFGPEFEGNGYQYEAAEAMRCLREGKLESSIMPLEETLAIMRTMDAIRSQWGLKYPSEM